MNIEHLCQIISKNYSRLKNKGKTMLYLKYQFALLAWKQQKLKLGTLVFEIKEYTEGGIPITEEVEIRYTRQDNTDEDEMKFENRLKALNWKWDFSNVGAFCIIASIIIFIIYFNLNNWYKDNLPTIAFRQEEYDCLIEKSFKMMFTDIRLFTSKWFIISNYWITDILFYFSINFDLLF